MRKYPSCNPFVNLVLAGVLILCPLAGNATEADSPPSANSLDDLSKIDQVKEYCGQITPVSTWKSKECRDVSSNMTECYRVPQERANSCGSYFEDHPSAWLRQKGYFFYFKPSPLIVRTAR